MMVIVGIVCMFVCLFVGLVGARRRAWIGPVAMVGIVAGLVTIVAGLLRDADEHAARCDERCNGQQRIACGRLDGPHRHDGEGPEYSVCVKDGSSVLVIAPKR